MYFSDPQGGGRRRALVRDKTLSLLGDVNEAFAKLGRDLSNRSRGIAAEFRARLQEEPVSDHTLAERVRAALGHVCSHPGAIEVMVEDGCVELKGPILASEREQVVAHIRSVRGVRGIDDDLEPFASDSDLPSLQS
jgi:hypothetical protein